MSPPCHYIICRAGGFWRWTTLATAAPQVAEFGHPHAARTATALVFNAFPAEATQVCNPAQRRSSAISLGSKAEARSRHRVIIVDGMSSVDSAPFAATQTLCSRVHSFSGSTTSIGQVMVIESGSSSLFELPRSGQVVVGRAPDAQLRLQDPQVSRHHARLDVQDNDVMLVDLGSHNGTRVNGERVQTPQRLASGDIITLCAVTLIYSRPHASTATRPVYETIDVLRSRLEEEVEQAVHTRRATAALCLVHGELTASQRSAFIAAAAPLLRVSDVVSWGRSAHALFIARPDCDTEEAAELAAMLLVAIKRSEPELVLRAGYASCPQDGYNVDALLDGAKAAAERAEVGQVLAASQAVTTLRVGERTVVIADPAMMRLYELIKRLAQSELPVLICGETGAGKEMAAQALHSGSRRAGQRLVSINCAALAESLAESELFGHEKGAFSGATATKVGLLEAGSGGTVFLDEIGELPLSLQAKLLRALETKKIMRVGDVKERPIDVRFVAATNRRLPEELANGRFRQDLYFRLANAVLTLPPLRERQRELPILARAFLGDACQRAGRPALLLAPDTLDVLLRHNWPGNLRELRNVMDYAAAVVTEPVVEPQHLPEPLNQLRTQEAATPTESDSGSLARMARTILRLPFPNKIDAMEAALVHEAVRMVSGNKSAAARILGVHRRIVERRLDKHSSNET